MLVVALSALLVAATLYQRPLAELYLSSRRSGGFLIHSWDLVWLLLPVVALGAARSRRDARWAAVGRAVLRWGDPMLWSVVLGILAPISLIWAYANFGRTGLSSSAAQCLHLFGFVALAFLIRLGLRARQRDALIWAIVIVSSVAAASAFLAWRFETTTVMAGSRAIQIGITRAGGPFGNQFASGTSDGWWVPAGAANGLGLWLAVCTPVSLFVGARIWRSRRIAGSLMLASVPVLLAGLLATHSRESWLAALFAGLMVGCRSLLAIPLRRKLAIAIGACTILAVVGVGVPSVRSRIDQTFTPGSFDYRTGPLARAHAWSSGLTWSEESFPIGWGIGTIETHPSAFGGRTTAENVYLQYFAQLGVVGLVALIGLSISGLRVGLKMIRRTPDGMAATFVVAFFAAFIIHGMFGNTLGDPTIQILASCALGLCWVPGLSVSASRADAWT